MKKSSFTAIPTTSIKLEPNQKIAEGQTLRVGDCSATGGSEMNAVKN